MFNLIIAVLCSVAVSVLLKVARKRHIEIQQAIAFNYIVALSLSWFLLKPDFKGLEFTDFIAQSENTPIFLTLIFIFTHSRCVFNLSRNAKPIKSDWYCVGIYRVVLPFKQT